MSRSVAASELARPGSDGSYPSSLASTGWGSVYATFAPGPDALRRSIVHGERIETLRTALIITVPEAEPLIREWRMRYDNAGLGVPAHVTLLFPFVPTDEVDDALLGELESLFGSRPRFSFSLPRVARFPDAAWLRPDPDQGFCDLTRVIVDRYPDYPPYGGTHDEVVPHITVAVGDSSIQAEVEAALTPSLPISAVARAVTLLVEGPSGHWQAERRFLLAP